MSATLSPGTPPAPFSIATWNVNSLKVRLPHLLEWLAEASPTVVCLQETKLEDHAFPVAEVEAAGYQVVFSGQKTYNGVAIVSRLPLTDVVIGNPRFDDPQKRLIAATVAGPDGDIRVVGAYFPNGQEVGSDKYAYKLQWLAALRDWLADELSAHPRLALCGDYNIAPADADVHDPAAWAGKILCSEPERQAFRDLIGLGLVDAYRLFPQAERSFSWWDYRNLGFQKNQGLRIDHVLLSAPLAARCTAARIERHLRKKERPSDHAPVIATLDGPAAPAASL